MKNFMLECVFSFEEYGKNVKKEEANGCSLETLKVLLDAAGHVLT